MTYLRQVFLIRHPKPDIAPGICYGSSDIQPIATALQAAFAWLDELLPAHAHIISSPLARCAQLASLLSAGSARICELDSRLAERYCGAWELQTWDQVARNELDAWATDFIGYAAPGAESVRQLQARVLAAWQDYTSLQDYAQRANQQTLVLITHAGPIQVLLAHLTDTELCASPIAEVACGSAVLLTLEDTSWDFNVLASI